MKAKITIGYRDYVMDADKAMFVAEVLCGAERYESKYSAGSNYTYHIWDDLDPDKSRIGIEILSDHLYRIAKLAGKPE
jgi:hypothetical protein